MSQAVPMEGNGDLMLHLDLKSREEMASVNIWKSPRGQTTASKQ